MASIKIDLLSYPGTCYPRKADFLIMSVVYFLFIYSTTYPATQYYHHFFLFSSYAPFSLLITSVVYANMCKYRFAQFENNLKCTLLPSLPFSSTFDKLIRKDLFWSTYPM